jgi:alpha-glucosidase (family GH31 glycosyl hydrolase)
MTSNIVGIPMAGSDICGFNDNTTPELCARWHMLGAFYPFSRNHNAWNTVRQEPYIFANETYEGSITYTDIMRKAMRNKYCLIRYMYTELSFLSKEGGVFFKPLYFEFWDDDASYNYGGDFLH